MILDCDSSGDYLQLREPVISEPVTSKLKTKLEKVAKPPKVAKIVKAREPRKEKEKDKKKEAIENGRKHTDNPCK